jgi:hypothetical protein
MSFLTRRVVWANWQFAPLKWSMLSLGIIIGAYFADLLKPYLCLVGVIFLVTTVWVTVLWLRAMRQAS